MRRQLRLGAPALLLLAAVGCAGHVPVRAPSIIEEPFPVTGPPTYLLQVGDAIAVKFWGYPELDEELTIRPDGKISLPFVDEVEAADRTPAELDAELTQRYSAELVSPQITVMVRNAVAQQVYVGSASAGGGLVALSPKMTLFQALQLAGGAAATARRRDVLLIRTFPDGSRLARSVDIRPLMSGRDPNADILLQAFDVIFLPSRKIEGFQTFVTDYIDPIYRLLPIRVVGTVRLFEDNQGGFP